MKKKDYYIVRVKLFFIRYKGRLMWAFDIAPDVWDFITQFIIPLF
jgi:hypothetical protein